MVALRYNLNRKDRLNAHFPHLSVYRIVSFFSLTSSKENQWSSSTHPHIIANSWIYTCVKQQSKLLLLNGQIISSLVSGTLLNSLGTTPIITIISFLSDSRRLSRLMVYISYSRYFLSIFLWARFLSMENCIWSHYCPYQYMHNEDFSFYTGFTQSH